MVRLARGLGVSVSVALGGVGSVGLLAVPSFPTRRSSDLAAWTTSVNTWLPEPAASVARIAVMVPLAPTAVTSVRVQPAGRASDTKVTPAGSGSLRTTLWASEGPGLATVIV